MWPLSGTRSYPGRKRKEEVKEENSVRSFFYSAQATNIPMNPITIPT
jgi:hypothetical protein